MRKSLRRAFALASTVPTLAAALVATAPQAHAATAPTCGPGSTVLADFYTLGGYHTRIASFDATPTVKHVCISLFDYVKTVVTLKTGVAATPPSVTQTPGVGTCSQRIIDMTAPISFALSVGASTSGPAICLGQNGVTTTVSFDAASVQSTPDVDVWAPRNSPLSWWVACGAEDVRYLSGTGPASDWYDCYSQDHQLV